MSAPRFMIVADDGSERGPFEMAELRWMWRRNHIDDLTTLKAEGSAVTIGAKAMAAELDAAGEEIEVLPPEPEPPPLDLVGCAVDRPRPSQPQQFLGLSDWQWGVVLATPAILFVAAAMIWAAVGELTGRNEERRAAEAQAKWEEEKASALRSAIANEGWKAGAADAVQTAVSVASGRAQKPTIVQIRILGLARSHNFNIADHLRIEFVDAYERAFRREFYSQTEW